MGLFEGLLRHIKTFIHTRLWKQEAIILDLVSDVGKPMTKWKDQGYMENKSRIVVEILFCRFSKYFYQTYH